ncbi:MAG: phenylalanine--tRNA ligase beta subunit-related protein, partial [Patescibacteria group bacterium]
KSLSNRPDLWGHYGMAREVAALYNKKITEYKTKPIKAGQELNLKIKVEDNKLCPRYMAVALGGIKVVESPLGLKQALIKVGVRPINNIVDITNYVMMELGQPMHAFDRDLIGANDKEVSLTVRKSKDGEIIETIDGEHRKLDNNTIVIAKKDGAIAIAGIMGGGNSGVNSETKNIVIESANFNPELIRRASQKLSLRSESSVRFEKGLDVNLCADALKRAVELIAKVCPGAKVSSNIVDLPAQPESGLRSIELD